jgi:hypothetical protein
LWFGVLGVAFDDAGLFDVAADGEDADGVDVIEVVPEVELGEPEGDFEFGGVDGTVGGAEEYEVDPGSDIYLLILNSRKRLRIFVQI